MSHVIAYHGLETPRDKIAQFCERWRITYGSSDAAENGSNPLEKKTFGSYPGWMTRTFSGGSR